MASTALGNTSSVSGPKSTGSCADFEAHSDVAQAEGWISPVIPTKRRCLDLESLALFAHGAVLNGVGRYPVWEFWFGMGDVTDTAGGAKAAFRMSGPMAMPPL